MPTPWHLIEAGIASSTRFVGMTEAPTALVEGVGPLAAATKRVRIPFVPRDDTWMRATRASCMALSDAVRATLEAGARPLILGGECSIVAGSVPGALQRLEDLTLVYFDAHGDFNTLATTPSHFMGGMCLAHVCGRQIATLLWPGVRALADEQVCLVGARELDPGEVSNLEHSRVRRFDLANGSADAPGLLAAARRRPVFVHLDLDIVDPTEMPAVNFPVSGGPSFDALTEVLAALARVSDVRGVEICGYDARQDADRALPARIAKAVAPLLS